MDATLLDFLTVLQSSLCPINSSYLALSLNITSSWMPFLAPQLGQEPMLWVITPLERFFPNSQHIFRMIWVMTYCLSSRLGRELSEGRDLSALLTIIFPLLGTVWHLAGVLIVPDKRINIWIFPNTSKTSVGFLWPPFLQAWKHCPPFSFCVCSLYPDSWSLSK